SEFHQMWRSTRDAVAMQSSPPASQNRRSTIESFPRPVAYSSPPAASRCLPHQYRSFHKNAAQSTCCVAKQQQSPTASSSAESPESSPAACEARQPLLTLDRPGARQPPSHHVELSVRWARFPLFATNQSSDPSLSCAPAAKF